MSQAPRQPVKKAVLVGCAYPGSRHALNGCLNDVACMAHCLKTRYGFPEKNIVVLKDDTAQPDFTSTRQNIMRAIQWLMADLHAGDRLVFHFSGHGSQLKDPTRMEKDGFDETILPTDFKIAGQIRDTELNALLVRPLPPGVVLHAVFDSCHSGTALDLPYQTEYDAAGRPGWQQGMPASMGTSGGIAVQIGACDESQTAADTSKMSQTAYTGAATYTFIDAVEHVGPDKLTYGILLEHMKQRLETLGKVSLENASTGRVAAASAAPLAGCILLGPLGLMAGLMAAPALSAGKLKYQRPALCCNQLLNLNQVIML